MKKGVIISVLVLAAIAFLAFLFFGKSGQEPDFSGDPSFQGSSPGRIINTAENYLEYSPSEYLKAKEDKKTIMLYFWANWCPTCIVQAPIVDEVMMSLVNDPNIIGFEINVLDSETTKENEVLAEKFNIVYQHTFVILNSAGEVSFTHTGPLIEEDLRAAIAAAK